MIHISRRIATVFLILTVVPIRCNINKKYVKAEVVEPVERNLLKVEREDLCKLERFFLAGSEKTLAVEDIEIVPAELFPDKIPRAVVHGFERSLLGSGAHREVHSAITLELEVDTPGISIEDCELVILERLSEGLFADPFQLHRLQQQKAVKEAHIYGDVDLERPAKISFQSIVELHQRLVPEKKDGVDVLQSEVTLPLHARYPPTSSASHFAMNITMPHVVVYCRGDNVSDQSINLSQDLCIYALWRESLSKMPPQTLHWSIPSGYPAHSAWVATLTTSTALAGVAAIFMASKFSGVKQY